MPIKPENKKLYPPNWKQIRENVLALAENRCEFCGVPNGEMGYRDSVGAFVKCKPGTYDDVKLFTIVLTIAHLDHDPRNNNPGNLRALCQRCHNAHDAEHRAKNAAKTRRNKKAIRDLFDEDSECSS